MLYPKYINIHDPLSISFLSSLPIVYRIRMRIERWVSYEIVHCSTKIRVKLFFMLLMFFRCILIEFTNHLICTPGLGATTLLDWTQMNFMRSLTLISLFKKIVTKSRKTGWRHILELMDTNLTSLPRSNIVGLVGIECGYGNDLKLAPWPAEAPLIGGRPLIGACPFVPEGAVVGISPLLWDGSQYLFAGTGPVPLLPLWCS